MNPIHSILLVMCLLAAGHPAFAQELSSTERELVSLINASRGEASLVPLTPDLALSAVARTHSSDMAHRWFFSHTSPITGDVYNRLRAAKVHYTSASESIVYVRSARAAHNSIMGCTLNRNNVLSRQFTHIGVGVVRVGRQLMVTENFIAVPTSTAFARNAPLLQQTAPTQSTTAQQQQRPRFGSRLRRTKQPRQCSVEGTWQGTVPNGMLRGRTVSLEFRNDGTATGTTGSIVLNTRWVRQGDSVSITDISANPRIAACPSNQTGQYTLTFSSDCRSVQVSTGQDPCSHRNQTLLGLNANRQ